MKVLIITNIPSPYRWQFWNQLSQKADLTVLFEREKAGDRMDSWYSTETPRFQARFLKSIKTGNEGSLAVQQFKYIFSGQYDITVIGGYGSLTDILSIMVLRLFHKPYILEMDGGIVHRESGFRYRLKRFLIQGAERYLSSGRTADTYLMRYGIREQAVRRYHFSSLSERDILSEALSSEQRAELRGKLGLSFRKLVVSAGSFIQRKGFDILLKAASLLPGDIGFCIIGGEPTAEYLKLIEEHDLNNVQFFSHMGKEQLFEYFRAADVFAFPTRLDIWGLVVNEAMSQGLPVITTKGCGAGLELVRDGENGYLVEVDDWEGMAERILRVTEDDQKWQRLSRAALDTVRGYTIEKMVKDYSAVFLEFLNLKENR